MNEEEFIGKLQMCYFGERNAFEEIVSVYEELTKENEKLNHYKLLYQKVKERNDKAIEYLEDNFIERMTSVPKGVYIASIRNLEELLGTLKGNNENI